MFFKQKKSTELSEFNPETIKVSLRPVLGIEPRVYVPAAWLVILLFLVFATLILPGIRRNGTWLTVYSNPPDSSVYADGKRLGGSGKPVFVARGKRKLQIRRPGFAEYTADREFRGRVFATLIRPVREEIYVDLDMKKDFPFWQSGISDFESWAATGPEKGRYAIPPVLTSLGRDLTAAPIDRQDVETAALSLLPMARDERNMADLNRLFYQLASANAPPNPVSLLQYAVDALAFLEKNSMLEGLERIAGRAVLSGGNNDRPKSIAEVDKFYGDSLAAWNFPKSSVGGMEFVTIPSLKAPIGDLELINSGNYLPRFGAVPTWTDTPAFRIAVREVSNDQFAAFVKAVPKWSPDNRDALIAARLADEEYLADWKNGEPDPGDRNYPVTGISWYAANAYTAWLNTWIFPEGGGMLRLPREDEWEIAARLNGAVKDASELSDVLLSVSNSDSGKIGLFGLMGNVREWCFNPFRYSEQQFQAPAYLNPDNDKAGRARAIRGGAFIDNGPGLLYPASARGFLDAGTTSPVVGFRVLLMATDQ